jgi:hypothetical protein
MTTPLDDKIGNGSSVIVTRHGDSKGTHAEIVWAGVADVDFGSGLVANNPVALAVDDRGRDIAIARILDSAEINLVDLLGYHCRDWCDIDGDDIPQHIAARVDNALNP